MAGKGALLLGTTVAPTNPQAAGEQLTLDSSDLTTHGVIVGMTGSGKTGLAIVMLEEALLAGIPVLVLDPKGDMGNLALTFPNLAAAYFKPWVNESDATAAGLSVDAYAEQKKTEGVTAHVLWMTTGLSCEGDSVAMTSATNQRLEDIIT